MNTFLSNESATSRNIHIKDNSKLETNLIAENKCQEVTIKFFNTYNIDKIHLDVLVQSINGIALKLSIMEKHGISIGEILNLYHKSILIDAENERLDNWLKSKINFGELNIASLSQLIFTVQVKRSDAFEQLQYFYKIGAKVMLVAGNESYLVNNEKSSISSKLMIEFIKKFDNIVMLGINNRIRKKIEKYFDFLLDDSKIVELYGYQNMKNTNLWIFYTSDKLSEEAGNYLERRSSSGKSKFLVDNAQDLVYLSYMHKLILFLDIINKTEYLEKIEFLADLDKTKHKGIKIDK